MTTERDALELIADLRAHMEAYPNDAAAREQLRLLMNDIDGDGNTEPLELNRWQDIPDPLPQSWVIKDWLPSGAVTLLSGPGGSGKSRLALQLSAAVAGNSLGGEWLKGGPAVDRRLNGGCPVVFASWEDRPAVITRTLSKLSGNDRPWVKSEMPLYLPGDTSAGIAGSGPLYEAVLRYDKGQITELAKRLKDATKEHKPALLVLDSAAAIYAANENDRSEVRRFLADWDEWAYTNDCAVLLLAHPPKSGADYSGSTDWQAGCRALWTLGKEPWGARPRGNNPDNRPIYWKLECVKSNYAEAGPPDALRLEWAGPALQSAGKWNKDAPQAQPAGVNGYDDLV